MFYQVQVSGSSLGLTSADADEEDTGDVDEADGANWGDEQPQQPMLTSSAQSIKRSADSDDQCVHYTDRSSKTCPIL